MLQENNITRLYRTKKSLLRNLVNSMVLMLILTNSSMIRQEEL
nr:MAG TPA: hypothetical protein [Caudoviricetes sp.]DAN17041.1 MAG TPA: hypothetical protein [Bacteriophage sp.]